MNQTDALVCGAGAEVDVADALNWFPLPGKTWYAGLGTSE